jgi:hypothetical protein
LAQSLALRVIPFGKAQSTPCVTFASLQDARKSIGLTQGVATFQQSHHAVWFQVSAAVDVAMFTRHDLGQFFAVAWHAQSATDLLQQFHTAAFMANVPW